VGVVIDTAWPVLVLMLVGTIVTGVVKLRIATMALKGTSPAERPSILRELALVLGKVWHFGPPRNPPLDEAPTAADSKGQ